MLAPHPLGPNAEIATARLLSLAPRQLKNFRSGRYRGDNIHSSLADFAEEDRAILHRLYDFLMRFHHWLRPTEADVIRQPDEVLRFVNEQDYEKIASEALKLGLASYRAAPSDRLAKTIHDLRGGGLVSLMGEIQLIELECGTPSSGRSLFFLTRDHLKIMRNALLGLDDPRREADLAPKPHSIDLVMEKWKDRLFAHAGGSVEVAIDCHYRGGISECCVEFGAVDRVLYNFLNNASRHAANGRVQISLLPVPSEEEADDLRFAIINAVSGEDREKLHALAGSDDLNALFAPGVSTTQSGLGLTIAADFVRNAYGLGNRNEALQQGYLGATLLDDFFVAWFHWPISHAV